MSRPYRDERLPDELQEVVHLLHEQRPALTPLELDRVKLRALRSAGRSAPSLGRGSFLRSRLAAVLTVAFLVLGTGGALATFGGEDFGSSGPHGASAADHEYGECKPGHGFGDKNHCHTGPPGQENKGGSGGPGNSDFGHSHGH